MSKGWKFKYINLIPVLIISFILYKIVNRVDFFLFINRNLLTIFSPVIWAFAIAYLLNPLMKILEKELRLGRGLSILIIYLLVLGIITFFITVISPSIANSIGELAKNLPQYIQQTQQWAAEQIDNLKLLDKYGITFYIDENLDKLIDKISVYINDILTSAVSQVINLTSAFFKAILSMIISIYFLKDKEKFISGMKKTVYAFFNIERAKNIISFGVELDRLFSRFIIGKFIDSCIIGAICFVGLMMIGAKYKILLSLIVGITNMIPYFGPFIGAVPAVIITLFYSPIKALWVLVFMIFLQQFDGLYLGPKILGDKVGLSPFWIIVAIIIGGGMFGVLGMFLGVPIMAVIKAVFERYVDKRLESKNIEL
ncbi:AI-2E family transporter [Wukongibacter sp. M2B1]|uniref:AI-2E family transporter n=1 Tax=Wukongibacter sp. M2B1 TaxID=3088895 RepID=UPI003D7AC773